MDEKLNRFAGFQQLKATDGCYHWFDENGDIVSPTDESGNPIWDETACFKWLVPKLNEKYGLLYILFDAPYFLVETDWLCTVSSDLDEKFEILEAAETPSMALCKAIEKLIDGRK